MVENSGEERTSLGGEPVVRGGVVEAIALTVAVPQGEVDVAAVARVVRPGLRGERGRQPQAGGDAANRLAHEHLLVRRTHGRRMGDRDLLLAVAELDVVLLDVDGLLLERVDELVGVVLRGRHPDRREAERGIDRNVGTAFVRGQRELVLEGGLERLAALGEALDHPLQERALAHGRGPAVQPDVVGDHGPAVRHIGDDDERVEVGNEAHLADRAHPLDRLKLVERVHRL